MEHAHRSDRDPSARLRLGVTATVLGGVLAALSGPSASPPQPVALPIATPEPEPSVLPMPSATPTPLPTQDGPLAPLTGLAVDDPSLVERRVVAVKIDNHWNAWPQRGLNVADAVLELPVESGLTRFIALFHTTDDVEVGPVRSGRPTDPALVRSLDATLLISGAQGWILNEIRGAGVPLFIDIGEGITFRSADRFAPHNLHGDTTALRAAADRRGVADDAPRPWFERGEPDARQLRDTDGVEHVVLPWSDEVTVEWSLEAGRWLRTQNGTEQHTVGSDGDEERIAVDHLVIIAAPRYTARNPVDGGGLPALRTTGEGAAWIVVGGDRPHVVEATWSRDAVEDLVELRTGSGRPVVIPPGRLWVSWITDARQPTFGRPLEDEG